MFSNCGPFRGKVKSGHVIAWQCPDLHQLRFGSSTKTEAVQITRLSPTFPRRPCRQIQRIHSPTSSAAPTAFQGASRRFIPHLGRGHPPPHDACRPLQSPRLNANNVTKPDRVFRRAIQHIQESIRALAGRYGINLKTVAKVKLRIVTNMDHRTICNDYFFGRGGAFARLGPLQRGILSLPLVRRSGRLRSKRFSPASSPKSRPVPALVSPVEPPRSKPGRSMAPGSGGLPAASRLISSVFFGSPDLSSAS